MTAAVPVLVDKAAEEALVGCVLYEPELWQRVGNLRPEDFGWHPCRLVWEAIGRLRRKGGGADEGLVAAELQANGKLLELGEATGGNGHSYLMGLTGAFPLVANAPDYAATVRTLSLKRQVQARAQALVHAAHDPNLGPDELLAKAQGGFSGLSTGTVDERGSVDLMEILDRWDAWQKAGEQEALSYLPHCLGGLTEDVTPGYPMSLTAVGGKEGVGKTTYVASEVRGWLFRLGLPGGIIGLEDGTWWLMERMMAELLGIPFGRVGACRLNDYQRDKLEEAGQRWYPLLDEKLRRWPQGNMRSPELVAKVRQWKEWGARWVVIDHGLRVRYESSGSQRGRYDMAIDETLTELAELARPRRDHPGMAIILAWHLNRELPDGQMPTKDHFKEGGYVGANCRYMPAVWMDPARPGYRLVTCTKANRGASGWTVAVPLNEQAGLLSPEGGYVVDFKAEREAAEHQRREEKAASRAVVTLPRRDAR